MTLVLEIQRALLARGFDVGPAGADGLPGKNTYGAMLKALELIPVKEPTAPTSSGKDANVPAENIRSPVFNQPKAARPINEVIVHCTATPEGRDVSVETIRGWHKGQGWKDIGYHWVVLLDGTVKPGRPEKDVGSHVAGHNTGTIGVVYVGGVAKDGKTAKDTRTPAQKAALLATVKALIAKYPTIKKVTGHNQYAAKACPSFDVRKDPLGKLV